MSTLAIGAAVAVIGLVIWARVSPVSYVHGITNGAPVERAWASDTTLVLLGDEATSNARGSVALESLVAERTGWQTSRIDVDGYAVGGANGTVEDRVRRLGLDTEADIVLVHAGMRDSWSADADLRPSAQSALDLIAQRFPNAIPVLVGPPPGGEVEIQRTGAVDIALSRAASSAGVTYLSPIADGWFGPLASDAVPSTGLGGAYTADELVILTDRILEALGTDL